MARKDLLGDMADDDDTDVVIVGDAPVHRGKYKKTADEQAIDVLGGVPMRWFTLVMNIDLKYVKKAVEGIKPVAVRNSGVKLYSIREVMPRLIKPSVPMEEYLKNLDPEDLPEKLRETYWNVQKKSQHVRQVAGELWKTTDVIEVIGEVFKHIKNTIMMWTDTIEEQTDLTDEQRKIIVKLGNDLQQDIHNTVIRRAKKTSTGSQLKEIDDADI